MGGYVYILASAPYGTLYVGITNDLSRRVFEHREHPTVARQGGPGDPGRL